jgi:hypothetical protein
MVCVSVVSIWEAIIKNARICLPSEVMNARGGFTQHLPEGIDG